MKYIRTKDGIYEIYIGDLDLNEETSIDIAGFRAKYCRGFERPITKEDILKIADTIEELCDEVVYVREGYDNTSENIHIFKKRNRSLFHKELSVYGAIWTDKGLLYVAKLNEEGEFDLL